MFGSVYYVAKSFSLYKCAEVFQMGSSLVSKDFPEFFFLSKYVLQLTLHTTVLEI